MGKPVFKVELQAEGKMLPVTECHLSLLDPDAIQFEAVNDEGWRTKIETFLRVPLRDVQEVFTGRKGAGPSGAALAAVGLFALGGRDLPMMTMSYLADGKPVTLSWIFRGGDYNKDFKEFVKMIYPRLKAAGSPAVV